MEHYRLTTKNNPYNPFTQWNDWYFFDLSKGYNTCERIAMKAKTSEQLPDSINNDEIEAAMDELLEFGAIGKDGLLVEYEKVENPYYKEDDQTKQGGGTSKNTPSLKN